MPPVKIVMQGRANFFGCGPDERSESSRRAGVSINGYNWRKWHSTLMKYKCVLQVTEMDFFFCSDSHTWNRYTFLQWRISPNFFFRYPCKTWWLDPKTWLDVKLDLIIKRISAEARQRLCIWRRSNKAFHYFFLAPNACENTYLLAGMVSPP